MMPREAGQTLVAPRLGGSVSATSCRHLDTMSPGIESESAGAGVVPDFFDLSARIAVGPFALIIVKGLLLVTGMGGSFHRPHRIGASGETTEAPEAIGLRPRERRAAEGAAAKDGDGDSRRHRGNCPRLTGTDLDG
jgi:hypothetical protein